MYLGRIKQDEAISPGDELYQASGDEQLIGRIVDAQPHPDGSHLALAVLQIKSAESGDVQLGAMDGPLFCPASPALQIRGVIPLMRGTRFTGWSPNG